MKGKFESHKLTVYILSFLIGTIINSVIGVLTGIKLGAFLLYIIEIAIAQKICKNIEDKKRQTNLKTNSDQDVEVLLINGGWHCPVCHMENVCTSRCEKCGVLPRFIGEE